jgi:hypothetical protein
MLDQFWAYFCDSDSTAVDFYRQSLQMQHIHAELYHNATALRGINGPTDVQQMPDAQRQLAIRSIHVARNCLDITLTAPAYREGMKYGTVFPDASVYRS